MRLLLLTCLLALGGCGTFKDLDMSFTEGACGERLCVKAKPTGGVLKGKPPTGLYMGFKIRF